MNQFGLVEGVVYSRQADIHPRFGGTRQSGISPAPDSKIVFIFTGEEGGRYGYEDVWDEKREVFRYTGHGQEGDMQYTHGNRAVRDHVANGHALLLFNKVSRAGGLYEFIGEMQCAGTEESLGPDKNGQLRKLIQFLLVRLDAAEVPDPSNDQNLANSIPLAELRKRAYQAVSPKHEVLTQARRNLHKRSQSVAAYVLARADGNCEACGSNAPFLRPNGLPYLEVHHIERLSDGGLDAPDHMAAICPTCHRRVHYGADNKAYNASLRSKIQLMEKAT